MSLAGGRTVRRLGRNRHPEGLVEIVSRQVTKRGFSCGSVCRRIPVNSPSVLVSIRFFGMGKGMGGDISQIKRLYAAITCSNFERTLPPPVCFDKVSPAHCGPQGHFGQSATLPTYEVSKTCLVTHHSLQQQKRTTSCHSRALRAVLSLVRSTERGSDLRFPKVLISDRAKT